MFLHIYKNILLIIFILFLPAYSFAKERKTHYHLTNEPIDVVIVTHPRDITTLEDCITGIRENCTNIGRIIVVSSEKLSDNAEWFDENLYPFSKEDVAMTIVRGDEKRRFDFFFHNHRSPGWYYQQLLKFYTIFVIPDISPNVLFIDSDTIIMNPVEFLNEKNGALLCINPDTSRAFPEYFAHAKRLVPEYKRIHPKIYSVCHHMLFQRPILEDLFNKVEKHHGQKFWKAFCECVNILHNKGASEFEIYYNFALRHTNQVQLRELKWTNTGDLKKKNKYKKQGYHFISFHSYLRKQHDKK